MKETDAMKEKKTDTETALHNKLVILAGAIALVLRGLKSGSIKAPPILNMDPKAENYDMISVSDYLTGKLKECGIEVMTEKAARARKSQPA